MPQELRVSVEVMAHRDPPDLKEHRERLVTVVPLAQPVPQVTQELLASVVPQELADHKDHRDQLD